MQWAWGEETRPEPRPCRLPATWSWHILSLNFYFLIAKWRWEIPPSEFGGPNKCLPTRAEQPVKFHATLAHCFYIVSRFRMFIKDTTSCLHETSACWARKYSQNWYGIRWRGVVRRGCDRAGENGDKGVVFGRAHEGRDTLGYWKLRFDKGWWEVKKKIKWKYSLY